MVTSVQVVNPRAKGLYKTSGVVALILGVLFIVSITNVWLSPFQDNWLIKLFKLNSGLGSINFGVMHELNALDIVILALVSVM
jgi:hypothetical protein